MSLASIEANSGGVFFAVDVYSTWTGNTGAIDASKNTNTIQDGGTTVGLLGLGMLGLGYLRRRLS